MAEQTFKPGQRVLIWATIKAPCNETNPSGLWWVHMDDDLGVWAAHQDQMVIPRGERGNEQHNWSRPEWLAPEWERCTLCAAVRLTGGVYTKPCRGHIGSKRIAIERLADDIDKRLTNGERVYLLRGAELDWVRDAIRDVVKLRSHGEKAHSDDSGT